MFCFSVFDKKSQSFATPFFCVNHEVAMRSFVDLCRDERTLVAQHPSDFDLYCLGEFNSETGAFTPSVSLLWTGLEARSAALKLEQRNRDLFASVDDSLKN